MFTEGGSPFTKNRNKYMDAQKSSFVIALIVAALIVSGGVFIGGSE